MEKRDETREESAMCTKPLYQCRETEQRFPKSFASRLGTLVEHALDGCLSLQQSRKTWEA
jgi:hypothetical protein